MSQEGEIIFEEGLIGFPGARRFHLLHREDSDIRVLQCLDRPGLNLPVIDPFLVDRKYAPRLDSRLESLLGIEADHDVVMLTIAVLQTDGSALANLLAPLVINVSTRKGRQVIAEDRRYSTRVPIRIDASALTQEASKYEDRRSHAGAEQTRG